MMYLRLFDPLSNHYILECQAGGFSKNRRAGRPNKNIYMGVRISSRREKERVWEGGNRTQISRGISDP